MDGRIRKGSLEISRHGEWQLEYCPFSFSTRLCGESCPLFGEPEPAEHVDSAKTRLKICQKRNLVFVNFSVENK